MYQLQRIRIIYKTGTLLLVLASAAALLFWQKSSLADTENNRLYAETQGLELEKSMIERELDSLQITYQTVRLENEELHGRSFAATELVAKQNLALQHIRVQDRYDQEKLHQQVATLGKIKIEYETLISTVRSENEQLRAANGLLNGENAQLRGANNGLLAQKQHLASLLEEQIRRTQSARFQASAFRIEILRKNERLTAHAHRAREINITFDLVDVPAEYQRIQKIYLTISDENGRPIPSPNPIKTTVQAPTGPVAVIAQQVKQSLLKSTQRLFFNYKFDDRLQSGHYVVAIYGEAGLLGVASFRLL